MTGWRDFRQPVFLPRAALAFDARLALLAS
jgi:hypothetical protein